MAYDDNLLNYCPNWAAGSNPADSATNMISLGNHIFYLGEDIAEDKVAWVNGEKIVGTAT